MTVSTVPTNLRVKQWDNDFFLEYIRGNRFSKYMGTDSNSIVQVREDLQKKKGDTIYYELVNRLTGAAVVDNATLEGNEEAMAQRSHALTIHQYRNAVRIPSYEEQATAISLRDAARATLMDWSMEHTRDKVITALGSVSGLPYAAAGNGTTASSAAQNDAWLVDNADRVLFGDTMANGSYTDLSADIATVASTEVFSAANLGIMKRLAKNADPKVRPIRVKGDEEWYVCFADSWSFRDFKNSLSTIHQNAEVRGKSNPLFTDGDLVYDGVIVREVPEIASLGAVGATSAVISRVYLCGAQALACGWAKRWRTVTEQFDYGDKYGVAVAGMYDINKMQFGNGSTDTDDLVDHGVVHGFFGAAASN